MRKITSTLMCFLLFCSQATTQTIFSLRADGAILKNGQPFFPMGFYINRGTVAQYQADIESISNAGSFNIVNLPYVEGNESAWTSFLNLCGNKNIFVSTQLNYLDPIYDPVNLFQTNQAVYGWSIADDADNGYFTNAQLQDRHTQCKIKDANHLTEMSLTGYYLSRREQANSFTAIPDAPSFEMYPITPLPDYDVTPQNALTETYLRTKLYVQSAALTNKPLVMNAQTFSWGAQVANARYPTAKEIRNMIYSGLAAGVKGIVAYAYSDELRNQSDLWNEIKSLRTDVTVIEKALLDGSLTRINTGDSELVSSYWQYNNNCYVVVINTSYSLSKNVAITLPSIYNGLAQPLFARMPNSLGYLNHVLSGTISPTDVQIFKIPVANSTLINYVGEMTSLFANPERGWHRTYETCADQNEFLNIDTLRNLRTVSNITLVKKNYILRPFKTTPLNQAFLDVLQFDLNACRQAGVKLIPLFRYNACEGEPAPNASIENIFLHMDQLQPIFSANKDVIAWVGAGFIGAYGEWHDADDPSLLEMPKKGQILNKLLSVLPTDRMVTLRTAKHKREIYDPLPISFAQAYSNLNKARVGHENDSYGSNEIDYGTYYFGEGPNRTVDAELVKTFLEQENNYLVQSGETSGLCGEELGDTIYHKCAYALAMFQRLKYTSMSHYELFDVNAPCNTIPIWQNEGCEPEIMRRLGYRFRLIDATIPAQVNIGEAFQMQFHVINDGWANPVNPRGLRVVLRNRITQQEFFITLNDGISPSNNIPFNPRFWQAGTSTNVLFTKPLPANIPIGEYDLFLHLFDPSTNLKARPEYAIRFANQNVWESLTGYNSLQASVQITSNVLSLDSQTDTRLSRSEAKDIALQVYPNPAQKCTHLQYSLGQACFVRISICNLLGQALLQITNEKQSSGKHIVDANLSSLKSGIYIVHVLANGNLQTAKLIVQ